MHYTVNSIPLYPSINLDLHLSLKPEKQKASRRVRVSSPAGTNVPTGSPGNRRGIGLSGQNYSVSLAANNRPASSRPASAGSVAARCWLILSIEVV